ncbi:high choriolytic enzyme 1-like [Colossoma macropomum]|uniref:high choriolytic enzyme 1-like n=1 Tax=Colossoma macropomum TaxID=42526 RepID=UPI0018641E61|nr:high choriolytic enzyme 1-like [Colossoma macropomum]
MEPTASLSILALLLLGLSQAVPLMEPQHVDITETILTTNNGSRELLVEGDIVLPRTRNALLCPNNNCFWKKSSTGLVQVPFTLSILHFSLSDLLMLLSDYLLIISFTAFFDWYVIASAMMTFHSKTCIRFVPRSTETDYLSIENRDGCYSPVGRSGGQQVVSLNRNGCVYHGIVQHELNHALGFYHEQTRSDRDRYVRINWANISPAMQYNFNKENTNNLNTPYDYSSVMHYGKTAFSINGRDTITPIPDAAVQIGQRVDLSAINILRINTLYKC